MFLSRTKKRLTTIALVPLLLAAMAGCSSPSDDTAAGEGTSKITDADQWQLAYSKCMRAAGQDVADPGDGDTLSTTSTIPDGEFLAADEKCREELGDRPAAPGEEQLSDEEALAQQMAVAKCFRDNGIDMPDPQEGMAAALPVDAPEDVISKCLSGVGSIEKDEPNS